MLLGLSGGLALGFAALLSSPIAVRFALGFVQLPGYTLETREVAGSLWRPELRGVTVTGPGISGQVEHLTLNYDLPALLRRKLRFSLKLEDADLTLEPGKFARTAPASPANGGATGAAWKVLPQGLELNRVRVRVAGAPYTLPDGEVRLESLTGQGNRGEAALEVQTRDGQARARVNYTLEPLSLRADLQGDATLGRHWWPGIQSGEVRAQYRYLDGALEGDATVSGGSVRVPGANWLEIGGIQGTISHRGNRIAYQASGQGLGGPVQASGAVDYARKLWRVSGTVNPALERVGAALNVPGLTGTPRARITASGWDSATVGFQATGNAAYGGVPIPRLDGTYRFRNGVQSLTVDGETRLNREVQRAKFTLLGRSSGWKGQGQLEGRLLQKPVQLEGRLEDERINAAGTLLESAVRGSYTLKSRQLEGDWNGVVPLLRGSRLRGSFAGPLERLEVQVGQLEADLPGLGRRNYSGQGYAGTNGYGATLSDPQDPSNRVQLTLNSRFEGGWNVAGLSLPQGIRASGRGQIAVLESRISGEAAATNLPAGLPDLSGPLRYDWKRGALSWTPQGAALTLNGNTLEARVQNLAFNAGVPLTAQGALRLNLKQQALSGSLALRGQEGQATVRAQGRALSLNGSYRGFALRGSGDWKTLRGTLEAQKPGLALDARYTDGALDFRARSGAGLNRVLEGAWTPSDGLAGLRAAGQIDLQALEALKLGLPALEGVVQTRVEGAAVSASGQYQGFAYRAQGNLETLRGTLRAQNRDLTLEARYDRTVSFAVQSGSAARPTTLRGSWDPQQGLKGLKAQGQLELAGLSPLLEPLGVRGLSGIVDARAQGTRVEAQGSYQGLNLRVRGDAVTQTGTLEGAGKNLRLSATYNKTLKFTALSGETLGSRLTGTLDPLEGLKSLKADGALDLAALETFGFRNVPGVVTASARGNQITARGTYQGIALEGIGNLETQNATLEGTGKNLRLNATFDKTLNFTALSGEKLNSRLTGVLNPLEGLDSLRASGTLDLAALETFGFRNVPGIVTATARGNQISARGRYQGIALEGIGNLETQNVTVKGTGKNLRLSASFDKTLTFTALSGPSSRSKLTGTLNPLEGLDSLRASGTLDLAALETFGFKNVPGIVTATARGNQITARGTYQGIALEGVGNLETQQISLEGTGKNLKLSASYNKTLTFTALSGETLGSRLTGTLDPLEGLKSLKADGSLDLTALETFGFRNVPGVVTATARGNQITARGRYQGIALEGVGNLETQQISLKGTGKNLRLSASYNKTLTFTALSGDTLGSRVTGTLNPLEGLKSLKADGSLDLTALETLGFQPVQAIVTGNARGNRITARGTYQGIALEGVGNLETQNITLEGTGKNLKLSASYDKTLKFTALSGETLGSRLTGTLNPLEGLKSLKADGTLDLAALETFGFRNVPGIVTATARGGRVSARGTYQGIALEGVGNLETQNATLEGTGKNFRLSATFDKTLNFTALSGEKLDSSLTGTFDPNKGLESLKADGALDLAALETFGFQPVQAIVTGTARGSRVSARGTYQGLALSGTGDVLAQTATLEGTGKNLKLSAVYNKTLRFTALSGDKLSSSLTGTLDPNQGLESVRASGDLDLAALETFGFQPVQAIVTGTARGSRISARGTYQGIVLSGTGDVLAQTATLEGTGKNLKLSATYDKTLAFTALSGDKLSSSLTGTLDPSQGLESVRASGDLDLTALETFGVQPIEGVISGDARGSRVSARGTYQGLALSGTGDVLKRTATLEGTGKNLKLSASYDKTLAFTALSGEKLNSRLTGTLDPLEGLKSLKADGALDLAALESFGFRNVPGIVTATARGSRVSARGTYQGIVLEGVGNLETQNATLEGTGKSFRLSATFDKTLNFTALSGEKLDSSLTGTLDPNKGLKSLKADGSLDLTALETFGLQNIPAVVSATARGDKISARATYQGIALEAAGDLNTRTADLRAEGRGLNFVGHFDQKLSGTLLSAGRETLALRWSLDQGFAAQGIMALEPLKAFGLDAAGTLALDLKGRTLEDAQGSAQLLGTISNAPLSGRLNLAAGKVTGALEGTYQGASARLSGQLYPRVQAGGKLEYAGETLEAAVSGPFEALRFSVRGQNQPRTQSGFTLPALPVALEGTLTPQPRAQGRWGGLDLKYSDQALTFSGTLPLGYSGPGLETQTLGLEARGRWTPEWAGSLEAAVNATLQGEPLNLKVSGPWSALALEGQWAKHQATLTGSASLPAQRYRVEAEARVQGYPVQASAQGVGTKFTLEGRVQGDEGGQLRLSAQSLDRVQARFETFGTRGLTVSGPLEWTQGQLEGQLGGSYQVNPDLRLPVNATVVANRLRASAEALGVQATLEAVLDPEALEVRDALLRASAAPYGTLEAKGGYTGGVARLSGTVQTALQRFEGAGQTLEVQAQTLGLRALWNGVSFSAALEGSGQTLSYSPEGGLAGALKVPYRLNGQLGSARIETQAQNRYRVGLEGPLSGTVALDSTLERYSSTLRADLSALNLENPPGLERGQLEVALAGDRQAVQATLALRGARYRGQALTLGGSGTLALGPNLVPQQYRAALKGDAGVLAVLLPEAVATRSSLGQLSATLSGQGADLEADFALEGAQYAGQPLALNGSAALDRTGWTLRGAVQHPQLGAQLEASPAGLRLSGLRGDLALLGPYLNTAGPIQGTLEGALALPGYALERAQGQLRVQAQRGQDRLSGTLTAAQGLWSVNLGGQALEKPLRVEGNLYPRASAVLSWDGLSGTLEGGVNDLRAVLRGRTLGRTLDLSGRYRDGVLEAGGTVDGASVALNADLSGGLKGTLEARSTDLKRLAGVEGTLALRASFADGPQGLKATGQINGQVAGYALSAPLSYANDTLSTDGAALSGDAAPGRPLTATLAGQLYPALALNGPLKLGGDLPASATLSLAGPYTAPTLSAQGQLERDTLTFGSFSVLSGKLPFSATLEGERLGLSLSGQTVQGTASATLKGGALTLNTVSAQLEGLRLEGEQTALEGRGTLGWTATGGLSADAKVTGTALGQALALELGGANTLRASGSWGQGRFGAVLGTDLLERPSGSVTLEKIDLARLWGRPDALGVSATLKLGGSYARPSGAVSGALEDAQGVLSGALEGQLTPTAARLRLQGAKLSGEARWDGSQISGQLRSSGADLTHLLPPELKLGQLWVGGTLRYDSAGVQARGLDLRLKSDQYGPLRVLGSLDWNGAEPDGSLRFEGLGGTATLEGKPSSGARLKVQNLDLNRWQVGRLSGEATLQGGLSDPALAGQFDLAGRYARAQLTLSGSLRDPRLSARGELLEGAKGSFSAQVSGLDLLRLDSAAQDARLQLEAELTAPVQGRVALSAQDFRLEARSATVSVQAQLRQQQNTLETDLKGVWPNLTGQATLRVPELPGPVTLRGQGNGSYALDAGALGSGSVALERGAGLLPRLKAALDLEPLNLLPPEQRSALGGDLRVQATLEGDPLAPTLALEGQASTLTYSGVRLEGLNVRGGGVLPGWSDLSKLSVTLEQAGRPIGQASTQAVTLEGLTARALSSELTLDGRYGAGEASFRLSSRGQLGGTARGSYTGGRLSAEYALNTGGYEAQGEATLEGGTLGGSGTLSGLPAALVTGPARFTLSGSPQAPLLRSKLTVLGAAVALEAGPQGAQATFSDGPQSAAQGSLSWQGGGQGGGALAGRVQFSRRLESGLNPGGTDPLADTLRGSVALGGTLEAPSATLEANYRDVSLEGSGTLEAGRLRVRSGSEGGALSWKGQTLTSDLKDFDLAGLRLPGYAGQLSLVGSAALDGSAGQLALDLRGLKTPLTVPYLNVPLEGNALGALTLGPNPSVNLKLDTPAGQIALEGQRGAGWQGQATLDLRAPQGGTVRGAVQLRADPAGIPALSGTLEASDLALDLSGVPLGLSGTVALQNQDFALEGVVQAGNGRLRYDGEGALADLVPALSGLGFVQSEAGYQVRANLESVNLRALVGTRAGALLRTVRLPDYLEGSISGNATFAEAASTFTLRSEKLTLAGEEFPARVEGTYSEGDWRLRGSFGDSSVQGSVTNGGLSLRAELARAPLHAFLGAFSGPLPGKSYATGVARYRGRLDDLLGGTLEAVAENLSVEGASQTLRGSGQLEYRDGVLKVPGIRLDGAGQWRIQGEYSPQKVDFRADLENTTFTPVLGLIPSLRALQPGLKGTLRLKVGGTFENPSGELIGQNLEGILAGVPLRSSSLKGTLRGSALTLSGALGAGNPATPAPTVRPPSFFSADGTFSAEATLSSGLRNTALTWSGAGRVDNFGPLQAVKADVTQSGERWILGLNARQGGALSVKGELAPTLALEFSGQNLTPSIPALLVRESSLSARGRFTRQLNTPGVAPRYALSGSADITRLLFGSVASSAAQKADGTPSSGDGSNFVSPLPLEQTVFARPEASAPRRREPGFLDQLDLENLELTARSGIRIDENLARGEFAGKLTVSGTGALPRLSGRLTPIRGSLFLRENEFALERDATEISFDPADGAYPRIRLSALGLRPVRLSSGQNVTLRVKVNGDFVSVRSVDPSPTPGEGAAEVREEKRLQLSTALETTSGTRCATAEGDALGLGVALPSGTGGAALPADICAQLYSLLALGTPGLGSDLTGNLTQSALKTALNVFLLGELERGVARALNLSVFRIRTNALDGSSDFKADFTVGTYLSKEFYLEYQVDLSGKGLFNAQYTTPDGRFSFDVTTPFSNFDSISGQGGFRFDQPSFGFGFNLTDRSSLTLGLEPGQSGGTVFKAGYKISF